MGRDALAFDYYLSLAHLYDTTDLNMPTSHNQRRGAIAESKFITECLQRDFEPHMPVTPMPWDFIVTCPKGVLKVQIKSSRTNATVNSYNITTKTGCKRTGKMSDEIDVVGCYVCPIDTWWLIPREEIQGKTIKLNPSKATKSKHKKYQENWSIFYE
jgi:hypothetical protein